MASSSGKLRLLGISTQAAAAAKSDVDGYQDSLSPRSQDLEEWKGRPMYYVRCKMIVDTSKC